MSNQLIVNIIRFIAIVLFQVIILDNAELHRLIKPVLYPIFILLLPVSWPSWLVLSLAMVLGLTVDAFNNTIGIHASACVFMAFCRPLILRLNTPRGGYEQTASPNIHELGYVWFLIYAGSLIFLFHLFFYFVEAFGFRFLGNTILKIIISSFLSLAMIILYQMLFDRRRK